MFWNIFSYIGENGLTNFKRKLDAFAKEMLCAEFIFITVVSEFTYLQFKTFFFQNALL